MYKELSYKQLKFFCDPDSFNFKTTRELEIYDDVVGQERARKALEFGLRVKNKGFNIFASGLPGTGKTEFVKNIAEQIASTEEVPPDLCYVYNFQDPKFPKRLVLPPGTGKVLKQEMEDLISYLLEDLPKAFNSKNYEEKKSGIIQKYQDKRDEVIKKITEEAESQNFGVKTKNNGIYFMPIVNGEIISEEQFEKLSQEDKDIITKNSLVMQNRAVEIMRVLKIGEKDMNKEIESLDYSIGLFQVSRYLNSLFEKYSDNKNILEYLEDVKESILDGMKNFLREEEDQEEQSQLLLPIKTKRDSEDFFVRYKINLLVDHSCSVYAPVIVDFNPTYFNLIGEVEYENEFGNLMTDFTKIKPGLFHKANGGYLILQATDIFKNNSAWELIRRVINSGKLTIEPSREANTGFAISSLKPEAFKANVKIIIVGSEIYYRALYAYDDDFADMFKILASFDYETDLNQKSIEENLRFIKNFVIEKRTLDFDAEAVACLIEYSVRLAECQKKLSMRYMLISQILIEANAWAKLDNKKLVTKFYINKAIDERKRRLNIYEEKLTDLINEKYIMIDTEGKITGQINGLAILDTGDYVFAKPTRITATTYIGKAGIINIEKEADMSGSIHDKGVQVLIGYLGQTYAQEFPLSLSCRICFEQNYNGIDGDSASSTELYAILSSLSDLPIRQDIAVTGSINQRGEIQVIGGVTYKIEGFFELCEKRGLTGYQGVIIPEHNICDLVLNEKIINAVKNNKFHIYPIKHINEGIEILTGVPAGKKNSKGNYPVNSVHGLVMKKLKLFHEKSLSE